jgi:uncharacterized protein (TIGR02145 family)
MAGRTSYYGGIVLDGLIFHIDSAKQESYAKRGLRYMQNGNNNLFIDFADTSKSPSTQNATGSMINGATFSNFAPYHLTPYSKYWHDATSIEWTTSAGIGTFYGNIEFDGINDYIDFGSTPEMDGNTDITVSIWFYVNNFRSGATAQGGTVSMVASRYSNISANNGWELYFDNQGVLYFGGRESISEYIYATSSTLLKSANTGPYGNGGWYNAIGTKSGNTWKLHLAETNKSIIDNVIYEDSTIPVLERTVSVGTGNTSFLTNKLILGKYGSSSDYAFDGRIMSLSIYNRALSISEITQNYKSMSKRIFKLAPGQCLDCFSHDVVIGTQIWTGCNTTLANYKNGDAIPQVTDPTAWAALTTGAWCYYNNDPVTEATYGKLYNWYAVNDPRGLAPTGYHVPTDTEWTTLTTFLGGATVAGGKMKETGLCHWSNPNTDATNTSLFTGLPGGDRLNTGSYNGIYNYGFWWSSTDSGSTLGWLLRLDSVNDNATGGFGYKKTGMSVRFIRDVEVVITEFTTVWQTDYPGSSGTNEIHIPIDYGLTYNYSVDWGDGTTSTGVTSDIIHTYATPGTYTVKISGLFPTIYFNGGGDSLKLLEVQKWGPNVWETMYYSFYGCENLRITATDAPNLSAVTNMQGMFCNCTLMNDPIDHWNTSNVTDMSFMFSICIAFDQPLNSWNTSAVTDMKYMFNICMIFNQPLNSWTTSAVTDMSFMFNGCSLFDQPLSSWDTSLVNNMSATFWDATSFNQPLNSWNVSNVNSMSAMFRNATLFNQPLNSWTTSAVTDMSMMFFDAINFNSNITSWNTSAVNYMGYMFSNAVAFDQAIGVWNTSAVTDMDHMFWNASVFNQPLNSWNTSLVTNMGYMFSNAVLFNQPLNSWNTSAVINMFGMFWNASVFNQPLNSWNTSAVINMGYMFLYATAFDQAIGVWDTSAVTYMAKMFQDAHAFNRPLNSWNTSLVNNMSSMFQNTVLFNQPLNSWNTSLVTDMSLMFSNAAAFNSDITSWNTSAVINMYGMFSNAVAFDQAIGSWNTSAVTNMRQMFTNTNAFNRPLNSWNTSAVTDMREMFYGSTFNQPIGSWNTSLVTNMSSMFGGSTPTPFNQNIGSWNVSSVTNFNGFMSTKTPATLSTTNLDAIYNGWISSPKTVKPNIVISFGTAKRTTASTAARSVLTSIPNLWSITDGGI